MGFCGVMSGPVSEAESGVVGVCGEDTTEEEQDEDGEMESDGGGGKCASRFPKFSG